MLRLIGGASSTQSELGPFILLDDLENKDDRFVLMVFQRSQLMVY